MTLNIIMEKLIRRLLLNGKVKSAIKKWSPILYIILGVFITKGIDEVLYFFGEENRSYNNMVEVVQNHNDIDKDTLHKMAILGDEKVKISIANKDLINYETFSLLSKDMSEDVRATLAKHPSLPINEAKTLALDWSKKVRIALVNNNKADSLRDKTVLRILSLSDEEIVKHMSKRKSYIAKKVAAGSSNADKQTLMYLYLSKPSYIPNLDEERIESIRISIASNRSIYDELVEKIIEEKNFNIIKTLAKNPSISEKALMKLINHKNKDVSSLAKNNKLIRERGEYNFDSVKWCIDNKEKVFEATEYDMKNEKNNFDLINTNCGKSVEFLSKDFTATKRRRSIIQALCKNKNSGFHQSDVSQNLELLKLSRAYRCLSRSSIWASKGIAQNVEILKSHIYIALSLASFSGSNEWGIDNEWDMSAIAQNFDILRLRNGQVACILSMNSDQNGWGSTTAGKNSRVRALRGGEVGNILDNKGLMTPSLKPCQNKEGNLQ